MRDLPYIDSFLTEWIRCSRDMRVSFPIGSKANDHHNVWSRGAAIIFRREKRGTGHHCIIICYFVEDKKLACIEYNVTVWSMLHYVVLSLRVYAAKLRCTTEIKCALKCIHKCKLITEDLNDAIRRAYESSCLVDSGSKRTNGDGIRS